MPFSDFAAPAIDGLTPEQMSARRMSSAVHPSNTNQGYEVDLCAPYEPMTTRLDAVFPRASIRPFTPLDGAPLWYAAKVWIAPGQPMRGRASLWVSKRFDSLDNAAQWAEHVVWLHRPQKPAEAAC